MFLIDPDGGANKLQGAHVNKKSEDAILLQAIPDMWRTPSKEIYKAPAVTFSSIFTI